MLKIVLQRASYLADLEKENQKLLEREEKRGFPEIIGSSPVMAKVYDTIRRVAGADISVLIVGESGTGKELVARAVHQQSHRKNGPFIAINCGAYSGNTLRKVNCLVMKKERLPELTYNARVGLSQRREGLYSWMRLVKSLRHYKSNSFEYYKNEVLNGLEVGWKFRWIHEC